MNAIDALRAAAAGIKVDVIVSPHTTWRDFVWSRKKDCFVADGGTVVSNIESLLADTTRFELSAPPVDPTTEAIREIADVIDCGKHVLLMAALEKFAAAIKESK